MEQLTSQVYKGFLDPENVSKISLWLQEVYEKRLDIPMSVTGKVQDVVLSCEGEWWGYDSLIEDNGQKTKLTVPEFVMDYRSKIVETFDLGRYKSSGDMFNYFAPGRQLKKHAHTIVEGVCEIRFNTLVSKPSKGGEPVVDDVLYSLEEGDMYILDANLTHWTTPVDGEKPRILASFGWYTPHQKANKLCPNHSMSETERNDWYSKTGFFKGDYPCGFRRGYRPSKEEIMTHNKRMLKMLI